MHLGDIKKYFLVAVTTLATVTYAEAPPLLNSIDVANGTVNVAVMANERCFLGDLDAMLLDISKAPEPEKVSFLLTLESLDDRKPAFLPSVINLSDQFGSNAQTPKPISLKIPTVAKPVMAGIFLCLDVTGENSTCSTAKVERYDKFFDKFSVSYDPKKNKENGILDNHVEANAYVPENRSYFFQQVLIEPGRISFPNTTMNSERYTQLEDLAVKAGVDPTSSRYGLSRGKQISRILASLPMQVYDFADVKELLAIALPIYSPKKCKG